MPYFEIPPRSLAHIQLFGIKIVSSNDDFMLVETCRGEEIVKLKKPIIWLDDIEDAMQLGAIGVIMATSVR